MSLKANKWGPAVTVPTESTPPALLPTDIAAAIAAGLSIRLGNQGSVTSLAPQQSLTAEFEINDSTFRHVLIKKHAHEQLTTFTGVVAKLRGVYKQVGAPDTHPNERKLHLFLNAGTPDALRQATVILQHCYSTGFMVARPQPAYNAAVMQQNIQAKHIAPTPTFLYQQPQQNLQYLPQQQPQLQPQPQFHAYPSQFSVPSIAQLQGLPNQPQQYAPQHSQLLPAPPISVLNMFATFNTRVSLGALGGYSVNHPNFNVKMRILGPSAQNIKHIMAITGCRVVLKERTVSLSPAIDGSDDMHLELSASTQMSLNHAIQLSTNLVETVRQEYVAVATQPLQSTANTNNISTYGVAPPLFFQPPQSTPQGQQYPSSGYNNGQNVIQSFPPASNFTLPLRPAGTLPALQMQVQNQNRTAADPCHSKSCMPFLYPDGDAVLKTAGQQINNVIGGVPVPGVTQALAIKSNVRTVQISGVTSTVNIAVPDVPSSSNKNSNGNNSSSSGSSSSGSSGGNSSSGSRGDQSDNRDSSSRGTKRRRGFQESTVYTAPNECPLPVSVTYTPNPSPITLTAKENDIDKGFVIDTEQTKHAPDSTPPINEITEPVPSVVAALAAMTERRLQSKISRPAVPSFGPPNPENPSVQSSVQKPSVPSFGVKPSVPLFSASFNAFNTNPLPVPVPVPVVAIVPEVEAVSFKLPGLTAYDDDDEDD